MAGILLFAHIILFVFSFAFTAGIGMLGGRIARSGDAKTIHTFFSAARPFSMLGGFGWIFTALTGGALAHAYGLNMSAPWLLMSYVAFAVLIVTGFALHAPWQAKVIAASANGGSPELGAVLNATAHRIANTLSALSVLALVFLMSVKPS